MAEAGGMVDEEEPDRTAEELLALEEELTAPETGAAGTYGSGVVDGATRIPAPEVPDGYPLAVEGGEVLRLDVDVGPETVSTYLPWPGGDVADSRLGRLLAALDYGPEEFADLYGDRVGLAHRDGWHVVDADATRELASRRSHDPRGTRTRAYRAIPVLAALSVAPTVLASMGSASPVVTFGLVGTLAVALTGLPAAVYLDGRTVEEGDGWTPRVPFWVLACAVPVVQTGVALTYLLRRRSTVAPWPAPWSWHRLVVAAEVLLVLATAALLSLPPDQSWVLSLYAVGWVLGAGSVYYDARYAEEVLDWDPFVTFWVAVTVAAVFLAFLWLPLYLLWRFASTR